MAKRRRRPRRPNRARWVGISIVTVLTLAVVILVSLTLAPRGEPTSDLARTYSPAPSPGGSELVRPMAVFIGDSYVGGSDMGGVGRKNWSAIASDTLGWEDCGFGVGGSGWTRGINGWDFKARIDWALTMNPSLIVFANGVNDLTSAYAQTIPAANDAMSYLRSVAPEVPVVIVGQIKVRDEQSPSIDRQNTDLAAVAAAHGATFVNPVEAGWFNGEARALLGEDRFHPTDEGNVYLADQFVAAVQAAGVQPATRFESEAVWCGLPDWRRQLPDGSPAPQPTESPAG